MPYRWPRRSTGDTICQAHKHASATDVDDRFNVCTQVAVLPAGQCLGPMHSDGRWTLHWTGCPFRITSFIAGAITLLTRVARMCGPTIRGQNKGHCSYEKEISIFSSYTALDEDGAIIHSRPLQMYCRLGWSKNQRTSSYPVRICNLALDDNICFCFDVRSSLRTVVCLSHASFPMAWAIFRQTFRTDSLERGKTRTSFVSRFVSRRLAN